MRTGNAPPTGTMAIAFTDVQSSTSLWQEFPAEMSKALKIHNNIMRRLIKKHEGYEVKTQGDSFMVCFLNPYNALNWAVQVQNTLLDCTTWPTELIVSSYDCRMEWDSLKSVIFKGLRVRIGIHYGDAERVNDPTTNRPDYFGTTVNKAARVESCAKGGQIVVSKRLLFNISSCLTNIETGENAFEEKWVMDMTDMSSQEDRTHDLSSSSLRDVDSSKTGTKSFRSSLRLRKAKKEHIKPDDMPNLYYKTIGEFSLKGLSGLEELFEVYCFRLSSRRYSDKIEVQNDVELDYALPTSPDTPIVSSTNSLLSGHKYNQVYPSSPVDY
ncbi:adenylate cyclase [Acrasis kona]|uniref:Adenylate cyclase n=1 Tax=Acrasis kona TaxID=1008807 RepID=A0AAW2Z8Y9_9EUKA